jgi:hypothetical protein
MNDNGSSHSSGSLEVSEPIGRVSAGVLLTYDAGGASACPDAMASKSQASKRADASGFCDFMEWCSARALGSFPADSTTVCLYLAGRADAGSKASTIRR